jgi:hypothetical protein
LEPVPWESVPWESMTPENMPERRAVIFNVGCDPVAMGLVGGRAGLPVSTGHRFACTGRLFPDHAAKK